MKRRIADGIAAAYGGISIGGYAVSTHGAGGVISPLLANIYLNYFDLLWEKHGKEVGELTRYADDFVVVCKTRKDALHAFKKRNPNNPRKCPAKLFWNDIASLRGMLFCFPQTPLECREVCADCGQRR